MGIYSGLKRLQSLSFALLHMSFFIRGSSSTQYLCKCLIRIHVTVETQNKKPQQPLNTNKRRGEILHFDEIDNTHALVTSHLLSLKNLMKMMSVYIVLMGFLCIHGRAKKAAHIKEKKCWWQQVISHTNPRRHIIFVFGLIVLRMPKSCRCNNGCKFNTAACVSPLSTNIKFQ